jgi:hypothetical protein
VRQLSRYYQVAPLRFAKKMRWRLLFFAHSLRNVLEWGITKNPKLLELIYILVQFENQKEILNTRGLCPIKRKK